MGTDNNVTDGEATGGRGDVPRKTTDSPPLISTLGRLDFTRCGLSQILVLLPEFDPRHAGHCGHGQDLE